MRRKIGFRTRKEQLKEQQEEAHEKIDDICLQFSQDILDLLLSIDDESKYILMEKLEDEMSKLLYPKK